MRSSPFIDEHAAPARAPQTGLTVLCIDQSANVLAYLRELLGRAGYNVLTNNNLRDAMILLRATRPGLAILGPNLRGAPGAEDIFRSACAAPVLELGEEFSTLEAGQAASELLEKIRALNNPGPTQSSSNLTYLLIHLHFLIRLVWLATHCHLLSW